MTYRPHTVIVGAGFAGLACADRLGGLSTDVTVIDQRNHHLFQPLLYQVATALIGPAEIAWPIRHLLRRHSNITTILASVTGIDHSAGTVQLQDGSNIRFDNLVVATGARHAYFGHDDWEIAAPGLKNLDDATDIRRKILLAFERAEREPEPGKRMPLLTFVIVGGGPTGVELAGTVAELAHRTLAGDYRCFDPRSTRVLLIEAGPRILPSFAEPLSDYAARALAQLGVEILMGRAVSGVSASGVDLGDTHVPAATVFWAAGVQASSAATWLGAVSDRAGRVVVAPDLTVAPHSNIWVIGDTAAVTSDGRSVPGLAPAAKQQGRYVGNTIRSRLTGSRSVSPFRYRHQGSLATIGRRAAIADFGRFKLTGWPAWWLWGIAHIFFLIGARNRIAVALNWLWAHVSGNRSARLITRHDLGGVAAIERPKDTCSSRPPTARDGAPLTSYQPLKLP
jgi:NADH dehydrogenase